MAITYGTILIIVLIPILIIQQFSEQNSGTIWLQSLKYEAPDPEAEQSTKKYYPTFLNVFIHIGYKFRTKSEKKTPKKVLNYSLTSLSSDFLFRKDDVPHFGVIRDDEEGQRLDIKAMFRLYSEKNRWSFDFHDCFNTDIDLDKMLKMYHRGDSLYLFYEREGEFFLRIIFNFQCGYNKQNLTADNTTSPTIEERDTIYEYKIPSDVNFEKNLFVQKFVLVYRTFTRDKFLAIFDL